MIKAQSHDSVIRFQTHLPNLTQIFLDSGEISDRTLEIVSNSCRKINDIRFVKLNLITVSGLVKFVESFPILEILELRSITCLSDNERVGTKTLVNALISSNRFIRKLAIVHCELDDRSKLFLEMLPELRILDLQSSNRASTLPIDLINVINRLPALEKLYLSLHDIEDFVCGLCETRAEIRVFFEELPEEDYFDKKEDYKTFMDGVKNGKFVQGNAGPDADPTFPYARSLWPTWYNINFDLEEDSESSADSSEGEDFNGLEFG